MQTQAVVTYLKGDYVCGFIILLVCVVEVEDNNYMYPPGGTGGTYIHNTGHTGSRTKNNLF